MPAATQLITSFLGGEISEYAQGRYDRQDYRTSMRVCLNSFPMEIGAWTRRPGTRHAGMSRGGALARTIKFDIEQATAITIELTDGYMRFRSGATLLGTNDDKSVVSISTANPAVVQTSAAHGWTGSVTVEFENLGVNNPLLQARLFTATVTSTTQFTISDAVTGSTIDGSTLGAFVSGTVRRVQELQTVYVNGSWANVRAVQAETTSVLLSPSYIPQMITATLDAAAGLDPIFSVTPSLFVDGPYLDPLLNGALLTPSTTSGVITLTLSFPSYNAATAYAKGSFVTSSSVDYVSLIDQNVGNTPASSPSAWRPTSASTAVNNGSGFLGTDVGRLIRLFSEPLGYDFTHAYNTGETVAYNPSGVPGAATYWQSLTNSNTGHAPGSDLTNWQLIPSGAAVWTWGKITSLPNIIDRSLSGSAAFGDMTAFGGVNAAFNGVFSQPRLSGAAKFNQTLSDFSPAGQPISIVGYVGKNYTGASAQKIAQATVYPSTDFGFGTGNIGSPSTTLFGYFVLNLRAKNTAPTSSSDGTLLGSQSFSGSSTATTIISNDQITAWNYVWVELQLTIIPSVAVTTWNIAVYISQISFFSPTTSTSGSAGCTVEILGPALLRTTSIATWRLGAFSDTTGWPTCGTFHEGRLWLGGAIRNRFDACVSDGITGAQINFAPTDQFGVVAASNALSYTLNSDGVNPIFWMKPDLEGVVIGTQQGEWLVQAPTSGPISPTNIAARRMTKHGSENVDPARAEHANLFVKRHGRKLMEYFADAYSGKFSAPNLADKASHVTQAGVVQLAYTEAVTPIVWGRDADNNLFGMTYRRTSIMTSQGPDFYGWHRHTLGSGRTVESISAGPSVGGDLDSLTLVTAGSATAPRHVEVMTDVSDESASLANAWFLDNALNPTSITSTVTPSDGAPFGGLTINGLWHLNGQTVQVFAGGLDCGDRGDLNVITDFVVTNGSCFVPFGDGISAGPGKGLFTQAFALALPLTQIVVGFTYNSDGQVVRLIAQADSGSRNGPALGAPSRSHRAAVKFVNTTGVSMGGNFDRLYPCEIKAGTDNAQDLPTLSLFTGIFYDQVRDDFTYDDSLCWRVSRPYPVTITAIGINLRTEDM